jgi:polar amino acid transport system substrate-binding protein
MRYLRTHREVFVALAIVAIVLIRALAASQQRSEDAWEEVRRAGTVRVGMDASYPPFEWIDAEGQFQGLDVALARALGERWGVRVDLVNIHFDGLYEAMVARRVDMLVSALPYDELMTRDLRYSTAYAVGGQVMVAAHGTVLATEEDLRGRRVAVEMGSEGHALLSRLNHDRGMAVDALVLPDLAASAQAVQEGRVVAMVCDRIDALSLTADGLLAIVGRPLTIEPYVIATRRDSPRMADEIQVALDALASDGTLEALEREWLLP